MRKKERVSYQLLILKNCKNLCFYKKKLDFKGNNFKL